MKNQTTDRATSILRGVFLVSMVGILILSALSFARSEEIWEKGGFLEMGVLALAMLVLVGLRLGNPFTSESRHVELPSALGCFGAISSIVFLLWLLLESMTRYANLRLTNKAMLFDLFFLPSVIFLALVTTLLIARRLRNRGESPRS